MARLGCISETSRDLYKCHIDISGSYGEIIMFASTSNFFVPPGCFTGAKTRALTFFCPESKFLDFVMLLKSPGQKPRPVTVNRHQGVNLESPREGITRSPDQGTKTRFRFQQILSPGLVFVQ